MIKVSIIIPVYNSEKYLARCLDSAINQTLKEIEIICVNDGSTDNSLKILQDYQLKDIRIKILSKRNEGAGIARNHGMLQAKGEYIGFIDSDDYVDIKYFEELYSYANQYDLIRGIRVIDKDNKHDKNEYGCIIPSIIKREFLNKYNLKFPGKREAGEDSTFKRWIYNHTKNIFECPDNNIYYHYMRRPGSLSNYDLIEEE